jgi:hypothetical protein
MSWNPFASKPPVKPIPPPLTPEEIARQRVVMATAKPAYRPVMNDTQLDLEYNDLRHKKAELKPLIDEAVRIFKPPLALRNIMVRALIDDEWDKRRDLKGQQRSVQFLINTLRQPCMLSEVRALRDRIKKAVSNPDDPGLDWAAPALEGVSRGLAVVIANGPDVVYEAEVGGDENGILTHVKTKRGVDKWVLQNPGNCVLRMKKEDFDRMPPEEKQDVIKAYARKGIYPIIGGRRRKTRKSRKNRKTKKRV